MRWFKLYVVASFLHVMAWGMYFAISRFYIVDNLGGGYAALMILAAVEWGAPATSILWSRLVDVVGREKLVLLGASGAMAFALMAFVREPQSFIALAAYASLAWGAAYPVILTPVLGSSSPGRSYSLFSIGNTLGWAAGSLAMGVIEGVSSPKIVFLASSALYGAAYALFYTLLPRDTKSFRSTVDEVSKSFSESPYLFAAVVLATMGIELGFNIFAVKLRHVVEELAKPFEANLVYGLLYGFTPSLLSIPTRVLAGRLADCRDPSLLLLSAEVAYIAYFVALYTSSGVATMIVWQLPIYPFYDVGLYATVARSSPNYVKPRAIGATLTAQSVGGSLIALLSPIANSYGVDACIYAICISLALSSTLTAMHRKIMVRPSPTRPHPIDPRQRGFLGRGRAGAPS